MENPNSLSKLPEHFVKTLNRSVEVNTREGTSPLEHLLKEKMAQPNIQAPQATPPQVRCGKYVFYADTTVMFLYALTVLAKKNKDIRNLLNSFNLVLRDVTGLQVFPKTKANK